MEVFAITLLGKTQTPHLEASFPTGAYGSLYPEVTAHSAWCPVFTS